MVPSTSDPAPEDDIAPDVGGFGIFSGPIGALGVIVWWLENDMPYPSDLLTNQIVLCMMGIGPSLGLRELKAMPD